MRPRTEEKTEKSVPRSVQEVTGSRGISNIVNMICFYSCISCSLSVYVEACLWLPVLLESALQRQLQGHDPGSAPGPGQNEKSCHQTVEAADRRPYHSELSRYLSCLCVPKFLNLMQMHSVDDSSLHALGEKNRDREVLLHSNKVWMFSYWLFVLLHGLPCFDFILSLTQSIGSMPESQQDTCTICSVLTRWVSEMLLI